MCRWHPSSRKVFKYSSSAMRVYCTKSIFPIVFAVVELENKGSRLRLVQMWDARIEMEHGILLFR